MSKKGRSKAVENRSAASEQQKNHGAEITGTPRPQASYSKLPESLLLPAIILLVGVIYSNSLFGPFIFDDSVVLNQPDLRISQLNLENLLRSGFSTYLSFRPLPNITFGLNYYFHGYDVFGYHLVNVLIHIGVGIFLFLFIRETLRTPALSDENFSPWLPFAAALIWVVNPLHTQSVDYVYQRINCLAAMFYLSSMFLYARARLSNTTKKKWLYFTLCVISSALSIGSKEIAATLPVFLVVYETYFFQRLQFKWSKSKISIIAVLVVAECVLGFWYLGKMQENPIANLLNGYGRYPFTLGQRILTEFRVVIYYISLLIYPHPSRLNFEYDYSLSHSLIDPPSTLLSICAVVGFLAFSVYLARRSPLISFFILWFFGNLVIESSIVPLEIIYEHRTYLPSMGLITILVFLVFRHIKPKWLIVPLLLLPLTVISLWTYERNKVWNNKVAFWADCVNKSPGIAKPYNNLGFALRAEGKLQESVPYFQKALEIDPRFVPAHINLASALAEMGTLKWAELHLWKALLIEHDNKDAHYNLAVVLHREGRIQEAQQQYQKALEFYPDHAYAHYNLGIILMNQKDYEAAAYHFKEAVRIKPDFISAKRHLRAVLTRLSADHLP